MTDLEICKRIAEIENINWYEHKGKVFTAKSYNKEYNPLTDDGLCFKLMVKYKIILNDNDDGTYYASLMDSLMIVTSSVKEFLGFCRLTKSESPNKAILSAIIEAHKEL